MEHEGSFLALVVIFHVVFWSLPLLCQKVMYGVVFLFFLTGPGDLFPYSLILLQN